MTLLEIEVGVLYASEAELKPLMTLKNRDKLRGDTIYFRYEGETAPIRAGDLHAIIREREQLAIQSAISKLQQISGIGVENSAVIDATVSAVPSENPAEMGRHDRMVIRKAGISDMDILLAFINEDRALDPLAFLKQSAHEPVRWLPLFYYVDMSSLPSNVVLDELVRFEGAKPGTIKHIQQRLSGTKNAMVTNLGGGPSEMLTSLQNGILPDLKDRRSARNFAMALTGLRELGPFTPPMLLSILRRIVGLYEKYSQDSAIGSSMRRSAARVDELLYWAKVDPIRSHSADDKAPAEAHGDAG